MVEGQIVQASDRQYVFHNGSLRVLNYDKGESSIYVKEHEGNPHWHQKQREVTVADHGQVDSEHDQTRSQGHDYAHDD